MVAFNKLDVNPNDFPPSPEVLAWCETLVSIMADGAVWGIPRSGTLFRIDKKNKRLICSALGANNDDSDFLATKQNFAYIGWDVVMENEDGKT